MIAPLAIVQARMASTRLPGKMLLDLGGKPLIWWAWNAAVEAFGAENVVVAVPATDDNDPLQIFCVWYDAQYFPYDGAEDDVLGRFHACAHKYRWHPDSVIVRVTPDDPFKSPEMMRRVADGERLPVELGGEAFTLAMLDEATVVVVGDHARYASLNPHTLHIREHITDALFAYPPPPAPLGVWTIDTQEDLEAARALVAARYADPLEGL